LEAELLFQGQVALQVIRDQFGELPAGEHASNSVEVLLQDTPKLGPGAVE
jgi:hypothetical protein